MLMPFDTGTSFGCSSSLSDGDRHESQLVATIALKGHRLFLEAQSYSVRRLYGFAQVDVARNRLASESIADGFEELMWIDSDIAFEPQSVQRLRSHGLPIVCGFYPKKLEREWSSQFLPGQKSVTLGEGGGLIEILYAAAGFLLVRRQVFLRSSASNSSPHASGGALHPQPRSSFRW